MLDKFIEADDIKPILQKHFVVAHLTLPEIAGNPGADKVLKRTGGERRGMPFHAFLSSRGDLIVNSLRNGETNIGYPVEPEEIEWFLVMLKKAAPTLSADDATVIESRLRAYKKKS